MMTALFGWLLVLSVEPMPPAAFAERLPVCIDLALRSESAGHDPALMLSVAWVESRFDPRARSRVGAVGIMQVVPRYFCPTRRARGCDLVDAGLKAYTRWRSVSRSVPHALCRYSSGYRCGSHGRRYARRVLRIRRRVAPVFAAAPLGLWTPE